MLALSRVSPVRGALWGRFLASSRGMSTDMKDLTVGRKTRSLEEQLRKLKNPGGEGEENRKQQGGGGPSPQAREGGGGTRTFGAGTMTLAERLSQSLKDPLRAKGFMGTVTKGEAEIECHEVCKVIALKARKGIIDAETLSSLVDVIESSDTNWYDKYTIMRGEKEMNFRGINVRSLAQLGPAKKGTQADQMPFLEDLFMLAFRIAKSPKNRILVMDGDFMGAGAPLALCHLNLDQQGQSSSKSKNFCIASTKTVFSIQSTHFLGIIPGCGASYFLPRLKGNIGLYLALTGVRLDAADCLYAGIATHFMPPDRIKRCVKELAEQHEGVAEAGLDIEKILNGFATSPTSAKGFKTFDDGAPPSYLTRYSCPERADPTHLQAMQSSIDRCFGKQSVDEIISALEEDATPWAAGALQALRRMSPTALRVTFELLRKGAASSSLEECIRTEWRICRRMLEKVDFFEAVRAFEGDKDGSPKWVPAPTTEEVNGMFRLMSEAELKPLELTNTKNTVKGHQKFGKGEPRV